MNATQIKQMKLKAIQMYNEQVRKHNKTAQRLNKQRTDDFRLFVIDALELARFNKKQKAEVVELLMDSCTGWRAGSDKALSLNKMFPPTKENEEMAEYYYERHGSCNNPHFERLLRDLEFDLVMETASDVAGLLVLLEKKIASLFSKEGA